MELRNGFGCFVDSCCVAGNLSISYSKLKIQLFCSIRMGKSLPLANSSGELGRVDTSVRLTWMRFGRSVSLLVACSCMPFLVFSSGTRSLVIPIN